VVEEIWRTQREFLFPKRSRCGPFREDRNSRTASNGSFRRGVEIVCGALIVLGLLTRFAAAALIIDMLVAISTTKLPILLKSGFWAMAHEARTDYAMLGRCLSINSGSRSDVSGCKNMAGAELGTITSVALVRPNTLVSGPPIVGWGK
jgi:hypothetical protein